MTFTRKDILGTQEMNAAEITYLLDATESFLEVSTREVKKVPTLRGKTIINLFYEPSTRPRTSFEIAGDEGIGLALLREAYAIEQRGPPDDVQGQTCRRHEPGDPPQNRLLVHGREDREVRQRRTAADECDEPADRPELRARDGRGWAAPAADLPGEHAREDERERERHEHEDHVQAAVEPGRHRPERDARQRRHDPEVAVRPSAAPDRLATLHAPWAEKAPLQDPTLQQMHVNRSTLLTLLDGKPALARLRQQRGPHSDASLPYDYHRSWREKPSAPFRFLAHCM